MGDGMADAISTFFDAWSVADPTKRLELIRASMAGSPHYCDPRTASPLTDIDAINEYIGTFSASAPGATAKIVKSDETCGMIRATIAFEMPNGMVQHGQYFVDLDAEKITRLVGFVGTGTPE